MNIISTAWRLAVLTGACLVFSSCESATEKSRKLAEQQAEAERALFQQRKAEVLAAPNMFLDISDIKFFDEGIINDYRRLIGIKISNRAAVPVRIKAARAVWLSDSGEELGTSPVKFDGTVPPGSETKFSEADKTLTSGTIQGKATKIRLEYTDFEVVEPAQR